MGRLLIVRHGETPWNAEGRLQGHADIDLSEKGRQQAREVAKRLADTPIDSAYSSDLARAWHTAQIMLDQRDVPLNSTVGLRERYYGVFEGLTVEERQAQYPDEFAASLVKDLEFAPPGGENARGTLERMTGVIGEIKERHLNETVLIVGHGGSLRSAIIALMELPPEATWRFVMANCSLTVIDTYPDNAVLGLYNDTSHLHSSSPLLGGHPPA
jgi:broad specificity phosphatase PhoE